MQNWISKLRVSDVVRRTDVLAAAPLRMLAATLNRPLAHTGASEQQKQFPVHYAWPWLFFHDLSPTADLSPDGYRGFFEPPAPFSLRMFAGGTVRYHRSP